MTAGTKDIKIMVVDDEVDLEPLILQRFRRQVRNGEYDFVFAHNGLEALSRLIEYPEIGVILSDINMPEMDGLTLLLRLKELQNPSLKTVIVSAYGDMDNIRTAMNRGAFDFVTKPINFEDLEITINKTLDEIKIIRNSLKEHEQLVTIQQDLKIASEIQQSILPKIFPPFPDRKEFDLHASMIAAQEIGGDFYDYFLIDNDRLAFVIGDVSGKGIPAAIFMAVSRTFIRVMGQRGFSAMECLNYANNMLCNDNSSCMFVTVFYGILNIKTGEMEFVNAGHNPPYIVKPDGSLKELFVTRNSVMGCFENLSFKPDQTRLEKGDLLYLYTDGVTEAFNAAEEAYGTERLEKELSGMAQSTPDVIINTMNIRLKEFSTGVKQSDDITMVTIRLH
ncbi:MAG: PP2C family protein-serine/threonine phosphatase [Bacteroidales bacterium]